MIELSPANMGPWLARYGIAIAKPVFSEPGGGVSNRVILVEGTEFRAIVKQSLGRLRVEQEWVSNRDRVLRESAALNWLAPRILSGHVPRVLLEVPEDFAIVIQAAPGNLRMWKDCLLKGEFDRRTARAAGALLASMISASWHNDEATRLFHDQTVFEELRLNPYYRFTAERHPEISSWFEGLIARSSSRRSSLVHGDFSPKNLLAAGSDVWAIDWEVVHYGDVSFDVAFLWNHLLLKSILMPSAARALAEMADDFTVSLRAGLPSGAEWVCDAALEHLPGLLLARVDGKSPAEYLDSDQRDRARALALSLIQRPAASLHEIFEKEVF